MSKIQDYSLSLVSKGNLAILKQKMKKAANGERITVAALGGSITNGSASSDYAEHRYADIMVKWWKDKFANVNYVNAGIGATGSVIGLHRLYRDILSHNPDVVTIDFAVNDFEDNVQTRDAFENIVRILLSKGIAVVLLFMSDKNANNVQKAQAEIGKYYNVPMLSFRDLVWHNICSGAFLWSDIAADEVHPNDEGHAILGEMICRFWDMAFAEIDGAYVEYKLPEQPLYSVEFKNPQILMNDVITPAAIVDFEPVLNGGFHQFPYGWTGNGILEFKLECRSIGVLYLSSATDESLMGSAEISVDGVKKAEISGDFKGGWGDSAKYKLVAFSGNYAKHDLVVKSTSDKKICILAVLADII